MSSINPVNKPYTVGYKNTSLGGVEFTGDVKHGFSELSMSQSTFDYMAKQYYTLVKPDTISSQFFSDLAKNFSALDLDKNGFLSAAEIKVLADQVDAGKGEITSEDFQKLSQPIASPGLLPQPTATQPATTAFSMSYVTPGYGTLQFTGNGINHAFGQGTLTQQIMKTTALAYSVVLPAAGQFFQSIADNFSLLDRDKSGVLDAQEIQLLATQVGGADDKVITNSDFQQLVAPQQTTQPTTQPVSQPATQPATQPVSQPTTQPTTQPVSQPTTQPTTQPVSQPTTQPTTQPVSQPMTQPAMQPVSQPATQPVSQQTTQSTTQPVTVIDPDPPTAALATPKKKKSQGDSSWLSLLMLFLASQNGGLKLGQSLGANSSESQQHQPAPVGGATSASSKTPERPVWQGVLPADFILGQAAAGIRNNPAPSPFANTEHQQFVHQFQPLRANVRQAPEPTWEFDNFGSIGAERGVRRGLNHMVVDAQ